MRPTKSCSAFARRRRYIAAAAICAAALPSSALAAGAKGPSLKSFLLRSGEETGFKAGTAHENHSVPALLKYFKDKGKEAEEEGARYEKEGFVGAATELMHSESEAKGEGLSDVTEFKTQAGARSEMKFELKRDLSPKTVGKATTVHHFKVAGVPGVSAFEFVPKSPKVTATASDALFVEGSCVFVIGDFKPSGKQATAPVIAAVQATYKRTAGRCP